MLIVSEENFHWLKYLLVECQITEKIAEMKENISNLNMVAVAEKS